ncbi:MAG TPA: DUF1501 domain-containing protein, partial [Planctomycetota bacterium]|nr:DUF1501 domain-containing protein [Planctomycetota bacterium]
LSSRRDFLATSASGLGTIALASLLAGEGLLASDPASAAAADERPLAPRLTHFAPRAKSCIFLFMAGAPSQMDLFDPKPELNRLHGQKLPESLTKEVRFAFIQKDTATVLGSPRSFRPHGECGMELSDLIPHIGGVADKIALVRSMVTDAFNHHPGQLLMNTGFPLFGRPSVGSWINYGLGSESRDLPGYVVLTAGRGTSGGTSNWSSGFLPSTFEGVLFRDKGEPILHLELPGGISRSVQRRSLDAIRELNRHRFESIGDPEIESRIAAYELAFRMQLAAPELVDLSTESDSTLAMYGVDRKEPFQGGRGYMPGVYSAFARNCLLARRLVERGVRFVNVYHASWDQHSDLDRELEFNARMADQPVAALIRDLEERGLLDETLVVWGSEFGRTPLGENRPGREANTGRDHHPFAFSIFLAGGGIRGGQVIGKTDPIGWNVIERPVHVHDLQATILHLFGLDHTRLTYRFGGRDFRLTDVGGEVVRELFA